MNLSRSFIILNSKLFNIFHFEHRTFIHTHIYTIELFTQFSTIIFDENSRNDKPLSMIERMGRGAEERMETNARRLYRWKREWSSCRCAVTYPTNISPPLPRPSCSREDSPPPTSLVIKKSLSTVILEPSNFPRTRPQFLAVVAGIGATRGRGDNDAASY